MTNPTAQPDWQAEDFTVSRISLAKLCATAQLVGYVDGLSDFDTMMAALQAQQAALRAKPPCDLLASFYASCAERGFDPGAMTRNWSKAERATKRRCDTFDIETEQREGWDYQEPTPAPWGQP